MIIFKMLNLIISMKNRLDEQLIIITDYLKSDEKSFEVLISFHFAIRRLAVQTHSGSPD